MISAHSKLDETCIQLKASFLNCMVIRVLDKNLAKIQNQIVSLVNSAPNLFIRASVIIDLSGLQSPGDLDIKELKSLIKSHGMFPIGIRGNGEECEQLAEIGGFAIIPGTRDSSVEIDTSNNNANKKEESSHSTKMVTTPIRSGMQVYAKEGDLVVTSHVSSGAELFSTGNIQIYGALRGRALAGVQGNMHARIFCRSLDAELVSIAGYYLTKEDIQSFSTQGDMVQVYLENGELCIKAI